MLEEVGELDYRKWAELPKQHRARWLAYLELKGQLEHYEMNKSAITEMGIENFAEWQVLPNKVQESKIKMGEKLIQDRAESEARRRARR